MKRYSVFGLLVCLLVSCASSTELNLDFTGDPLVKKLGTRFFYRLEDIDREGTATSIRFDTSEVIEVGLTILGKTNVSRLDGIGPSYIAYEQTGDVAIPLIINGEPGAWITLPITSKSEQTLSTSFDSMAWRFQSNYVRLSSLEVGAEHVWTERIHLHVFRTGFSFGRYAYEFSRKLGAMTSIESFADSIGLETGLAESRTTLVGYESN